VANSGIPALAARDECGEKAWGAGGLLAKRSDGQFPADPSDSISASCWNDIGPTGRIISAKVVVSGSAEPVGHQRGRTVVGAHNIVILSLLMKSKHYSCTKARILTQFCDIAARVSPRMPPKYCP
jgi:hypothetical protein